jgi:integrase
MLNALPKTSEHVFGGRCLEGHRWSYTQQRKRLAHKLQDPRLLRITFHTFRHWKATMEYSKTKEILYVKQFLGHRNINSTLTYTQLVNFESEEYHVRISKTIEEDKELLEEGFEYVTDREGLNSYRKRKQVCS